MAMFYTQDVSFHEGEEEMMRKMHVPPMDNPTVPALSPQLSNHLQIAPLIAIGTLDAQGRPWSTLWGGEKGMARPLGGGVVGIKTPVTGKHDPVIEELVGKEASGQIIKEEEGKGRMVSGLTIDLETRKRVKLYGRMIAGALGTRDDEITGHSERVAEVQLVLNIQQSLGNCPKYLNKKSIQPALSKPELLSDSPKLSQRAIDLVEKADLFFVSSSNPEHDMDTNHRGGPSGFLRASSTESETVLVWPEYSGNRLYQTLGNLAINPLAGLCVPDFDTGDMLYVTGRTEILVGKDAAALLPRSNLCVKLTVTEARFVAQALPFRGIQGERSPYNPIVRYLASEKPPPKAEGEGLLQQATLMKQTRLTPTISKFRFSLQNAASFKPGQYVTFDFSEHLNIGYSHMRDDDPRSINDDFVRTFTVSSPPGHPPNPVLNLEDDEFEITIRKVGVATEWLFKHEGASDRMRLEVGVKGFGGEFEVQQGHEEIICFIAAGVGITPILPSLWTLDFERLRLVWTVREEDIGLVLDIVGQHPKLGLSLQVFITNATSASDEGIQRLLSQGATVHKRRLNQQDLDLIASKYYLCTAVPMRKQLEQWLPGKELIFEDFNF